MPRKKRKKLSIKDKIEIKENVDLAKKAIEDLAIKDEPKDENKIKEDKTKFESKMEAVAKAINSPEGKKLALKIKVYNGVCHIYQGLFKNVWGRINPNGTHTIYRHALTNMLRKNPETRDLF